MRLYPVAAQAQWTIHPDTKVEWLIDKDTGTWNEEKLALFTVNDANAIRRVPLGQLSCDDFPFWPSSKNGIYSVKSGYHFIQHCKSEQQSSTSGGSSMKIQKNIWRKLWSLEVAPRIRNFCWRLLLNALPCYENLMRRKVQVDDWCPLCQTEDGSLLHLFAYCPVAIQVWALSYLGTHLKPNEVNSIRDWVLNVMMNCDAEVSEKFCVILWLLWKNRNDAIFAGEKLDPWRLLNKALKFWNEYREMNVTACSRNEEACKWTLPPEGSLKINVDAACDGNGRNGLRMIVRDSRGIFIFAKVRHIPHCNDVKVLEARAIKMACEWCVENEVSKVIIESDALNIICMLKDGLERRDASRIFVLETLKIAQGKELSYNWCPRAANEAAHVLATFARDNQVDQEWKDAISAFAEKVVLDNMA